MTDNAAATSFIAQSSLAWSLKNHTSLVFLFIPVCSWSWCYKHLQQSDKRGHGCTRTVTSKRPWLLMRALMWEIFILFKVVEPTILNPYVYKRTASYVRVCVCVCARACVYVCVCGRFCGQPIFVTEFCNFRGVLCSCEAHFGHFGAKQPIFVQMRVYSAKHMLSVKHVYSAKRVFS